MIPLTHCRRVDSIFQNMSRRAQSIPEPQEAFIAFIAFMGAMAGAGSFPERREAREILEATAATRQLMVGSCNPATALLVEERRNNEALDLLASCCCDVQSAENPPTSHDPERALFSLYRQRPSGSLELGPKDPATSRNSPACIVRMRGPKLLTSSPSSPGAQLRLLRCFPS